MEKCFRDDSSMICTSYDHAHINIYIYMLPPRNLPVSIFYCVLQWCLLVFAFKSSQHCFHSFEDFGCLNMMSHDASCVDTMTYFDGICSVFDYRIVFPTKGFNSNIDRMRTALWPNVNLKLYIVFTMFLFLLVSREILVCMLSDLADILFDDQYGRYVLGLFPYYVVSLLLYCCSGSILWMVCGS